MPGNEADMIVAMERLCKVVMFDRDFQIVLDSLVQEFGLNYPPVTVRLADEMYMLLRGRVLARVRGEE